MKQRKSFHGGMKRFRELLQIIDWWKERGALVSWEETMLLLSQMSFVRDRTFLDEDYSIFRYKDVYYKVWKPKGSRYIYRFVALKAWVHEPDWGLEEMPESDLGGKEENV